MKNVEILRSNGQYTQGQVVPLPDRVARMLEEDGTGRVVSEAGQVMQQSLSSTAGRPGMYGGRALRSSLPRHQA